MFAAATMTAVLPSCTNLDEITYDRIDASAYYQDENSVKGAVASIYASAQSGFLEYFWYLNEFPADRGSVPEYPVRVKRFFAETYTRNESSKRRFFIGKL